MLAVPGIPLLGGYQYLEAQKLCSERLGLRFYEIAEPKIKASGTAEQVSRLELYIGLKYKYRGPTEFDKTLENTVRMSISQNVMSSEDASLIFQQVAAQRTTLCQGLGRSGVANFLGVAAAVLVAFAALWGLLRLGGWVLAGFRRA